MDYKLFFADLDNWMQAVNQSAVKHGLQSESFWTWIVSSAADITKKYNEHRLAVRMMITLVEWIEEVSKKGV